MTDQHSTPPTGFDPYAPVGSGEPTYAPPPYRFDPVTGEPVAGAHAAPVEGRPDYARIEQLEAETGVGSPEIDPSRPCRMTAGDLFMTLNGFDEIAVTTRFGATITELRADAVTLGRALAFVDARRKAQGQPGADEYAYNLAMNLTIEQVTHGYFQPEPTKESAPEAPSGEAPGVS